jgi:hypothetical protein
VTEAASGDHVSQTYRARQAPSRGTGVSPLNNHSLKLAPLPRSASTGEMPVPRDELLTLAEAAAVLVSASGVRVTYKALHKTFFARRAKPPCRLIAVDAGRKYHGRPAPTWCIRRSDVPALAAHLGIILSPTEAAHHA